MPTMLCYYSRIPKAEYIIKTRDGLGSWVCRTEGTAPALEHLDSGKGLVTDGVIKEYIQ